MRIPPTRTAGTPPVNLPRQLDRLERRQQQRGRELSAALDSERQLNLALRAHYAALVAGGYSPPERVASPGVPPTPPTSPTPIAPASGPPAPVSPVIVVINTVRPPPRT